jgi:hypothetical protein
VTVGLEPGIEMAGTGAALIRLINISFCKFLEK